MNAKESIENAVIECREGFEVSGPAPAEIMFAPGGVHNIWVSRGETPVNVTVAVNRQTAERLQAKLREQREPAHRPYFDFNHADAEASGWPTEFLWRDTPLPGVYAKVEWSAAGREAIAGKEYRSFSPCFMVDDPKKNPAQLTDTPLNMGGLVNKPAFRKILPLWAKSTEGSTKVNMTPEELAALQAKLQKLEKENAELKAQQASSETEAALAAKDTEITELKGKIVSFEAAAKEQRKKDAKAAVDAAVVRGALPPKDDKLQAKWREMIEQDPANAEVLAKMQGSPALKPITKPAGPKAEITRESNPALLSGYLAAAEGKDRGAFYASEIRPRLEEGDPIPLRAADVSDNDLGILSGSLLTQRILDLFRLEFMGILQRISTDFSDARAQYGQSIVTRIVVVPAVESYHETNGWVQNTAAQTTDVTVAINAHKGVPISFNTQLLGSTVRRLFDEQAPAASYALAKDVIDALYAVITAANFANPAPEVVAAVNFGRKTFTNVGATFNKGGVPQTNRFALINSDFHEMLENDATLVSLAVYQRPNIITDGMLPQIKKFQPIEAPNLPTTGNLAAFFGHKSSLLVAARVPNDYTAVLPGASHGSVQTITDSDTGLSVMLVQYVDHQKATANWRIALMYGVAKGNTAGGKIIKSA